MNSFKFIRISAFFKRIQKLKISFYYNCFLKLLKVTNINDYRLCKFKELITEICIIKPLLIYLMIKSFISIILIRKWHFLYYKP